MTQIEIFTKVFIKLTTESSTRTYQMITKSVVQVKQLIFPLCFSLLIAAYENFFSKK